MMRIVQENVSASTIVRNPATGEEITRVPSLERAEVDAAIERAAAAGAFLASDDSSFMTASTFLVDGGISGAYVTPLCGRDGVGNTWGLRGDVWG
jgi:NAD(P)-dependent dehydrogenase (short-subunit alcohol dehydrogenase family)